MRFNSKRGVVIAAIMAILVATPAAFLALKNESTPTAANDSTSVEPRIDMAPATDEEKKLAEDRKDQIADVDAKQSDSPVPSSSTKPVIVYADSGEQTVEVGAFIPGLNGDGTCILNITKGSSRVTKYSEAFEDVSTTNCRPFSVQRSEFTSKGTWQVSVTFSSGSKSGTSDVKNIEI